MDRLKWETERRLRARRFSATSVDFADSPLLECDAWSVGEFVRRKLLPLVGPHPFPPNELMLMVAAFVWTKPALLIEWGTNLGISARVFHETKQWQKLDTELHSIDIPPDHTHVEQPGTRRGLLVRNKGVHLHLGDGADTARSILADNGSPTTLVLVDGDHSKESVLRDITITLEEAPDARLLVHDTFFQPGSGYNHGPYEAVSEALRGIARGHVAISEALGRPGMTFLYPSPAIEEEEPSGAL